jgi:cap1 methyltransferase
MNRAALKMANIDAATDFMFTNVDHSVHHENHLGPYYFADVCAGPGGFTEYVLWRKKWLFKGFGFTLRDENDFKLTESICASPVTFLPMYGVNGDGNVCCPENIEDFKEKVLHETENRGVHFMMSDGVCSQL